MGDDLFYTGQAEYKKGTLSITMKNGEKLARRLQRLENGGRTAIERTVSDFAARAPGWVSKGIRQHYGVDTAAIKEAAMRPKRGGTSVRVAGVMVDGATLKYEGRTLTPTHFKMSPKTKNPKGLTAKKELKIPGQTVNFKKGPPGQVAMSRVPRPYTVKATILKGGRASMKQGTFIASGNGGSILPFQREAEKRTPIEAVRTLSVPQMISGKAKETIQEILSINLEKRFEHHIQQAMR